MTSTQCTQRDNVPRTAWKNPPQSAATGKDVHVSVIVIALSWETDLVDVLALELRDELLKALIVGLDTDGTKDLLHIPSRGGGVPTNLEEQVCSNVTHLAVVSL